MKDNEIENALAESPPVGMIEELSQHNLSVPRGLDRRWLFRGFVACGRLEWMVPCPCNPGGWKIRCGRFVYSLSPKEAYFVGICSSCGVVHWLQEDENKKG